MTCFPSPWYRLRLKVWPTGWPVFTRPEYVMAVRKLRLFRLSLLLDRAPVIYSLIAEMYTDLTDGNVLRELKDIHSWSRDQVYQYLGAPRSEPLRRFDGSTTFKSAPVRVVEDVRYREIQPSFFSGGVRIADFGQSFFAKHPPSGFPGMTTFFLPPEVLFDMRTSRASDIWSFGCIVFQIYTSRPLMPAFFPQLDLALGTIVNTIGPLPKQWQSSYSYQGGPLGQPPAQWFDKNFCDMSRPLRPQLEKHCRHLSPVQLDGLYRLLLQMLVYEPEKRSSAQELAAQM